MTASSRGKLKSQGWALSAKFAFIIPILACVEKKAENCRRRSKEHPKITLED